MKKKILLLIISVLILVLFAGCLSACNRASDGEMGDYASDSAPGGASNKLQNSADSSADPETAPDRKIIYYVYVSMNAEDVKAVVTAVKGALNSDEWTDSESTSENSAYVTVRVKTTRLDAFVDGLSSMGSVYETRKSGEDVSINYSDNTNRIATLTAERAKLDTLLSSAATIADTLAITKRISEIDTELDKLNGVIRNYDSLIEYSTVQISVYKTGYSSERTFGERLKDAFGTGWEVVQSVFIFLIVIIPLVAVIVLIIVGVKHIRRYKKSGKKSKKDSDDGDRMDHIA